MNPEIIKHLQSKQIKLCAIATASIAGIPDNAVMGYAVKDDGTIILSTHKGNKKYMYIKDNSRVALVFGWSFDDLYIQCDGEAMLIEEGDVYTQCDDFFFSVNPMAAKFKNDETIFIQIKPTHVRSTDFRTSPPHFEESVIN